LAKDDRQLSINACDLLARALLSVMSDSERESLLRLLKRLHGYLPEVELAKQRHVGDRFPGVAKPRRREEDEQ
jgi:hypothetical protein